MAEEKGAQDKSEKPTPKRRSQAREKGQVSKSQELSGVMVLMAGLVGFLLFGAYIYNQIMGFMRFMLSGVAQTTITRDGVLGMFTDWSVFFFSTIAPILLFVVLAAVIINVIQVGFLWAPTRIKPDLKKINPLSGLKRLFSKQTVFNLFKNIMKLVVVGAVAYFTVSAEWEQLAQLGDQKDVISILLYLMSVCFKIFWRAVLAMLVLAVLDWAYTKYEFEKNLKMSKQEVKDEYKQSEGDPKVKARIRSLQREASRKRMMSSVPEADVVITNPTHLAVALAYKAGEMDAPQVVAKGANKMAEKIKDAAREAGVPIVEDKPLARALFKMAEVGQTIPFELYEAVATILAHVYRQKNKHEEVLAAARGSQPDQP